MCLNMCVNLSVTICENRSVNMYGDTCLLTCMGTHVCKHVWGHMSGNMYGDTCLQTCSGTHGCYHVWGHISVNMYEDTCL
jgi:hypothetical protein